MTKDIQDEVTDLAATCVRIVDDALQLKLDYNQETLPILDHYLSSVSGRNSEESLTLLASCAGAYFGETIRKSHDVRWHFPIQTPQACRLEFVRCFLFFNPVGVAMEALLGDDAAGYGAHFQMLDDDRNAAVAALEVSGEVDADRYYRMTMRWEALQVVLEALHSRQSEQESRPLYFDREVYRSYVSAQDEHTPQHDAAKAD